MIQQMMHFQAMESAEECRKKTLSMLMGDEEYPEHGYRPIDIRDRVKELLEREKRAKEICDKKLFKGIGICPYCGWRH